MTNLTKAYEFAAKAHEGQMYGKFPYTYHLIQVVRTLQEWRDYNSFPINNYHLVVGYLHDILEDTPTAISTIIEEFDEFTLAAVWCLTKKPNITYEEYISKLVKNDVAYYVKLADTKCNLEASFKSGEEKRIAKYGKQLEALVNARSK